MPATIAMTNQQHVNAGLTVLDKDKQPLIELPAGATAEFVSSNPDVADFEEDASGLNGDVTSGKVGSTVITGTVTLADGSKFTDTLTVNVTNSSPSSANFTVGTPIDEAL